MYAPAALAFVVVYKASRMMNFALGEWLMLGSRLVATGIHGLGLGLVAAIAAVMLVAVGAFFRVSRAGVALRAIADDQQVAMTAGIDVERYFALTWMMMGVLSVLAGTLWTVVSGSGFGVVLLGLKVFPIVIIGGLDSIAGTVVGANVIGVLESVAAGYLDPIMGGGFSHVASYLVLLAALFVRPHGLFGRPDVERV